MAFKARKAGPSAVSEGLSRKARILPFGIRGDRVKLHALLLHANSAAAGSRVVRKVTGQGAKEESLPSRVRGVRVKRRGQVMDVVASNRRGVKPSQAKRAAR